MKTNRLFGLAMIIGLMMAIPFATAFDGVAEDLNTRQLKQAKERIPASLEETQSKIAPISSRYLLWTHDGRHILWGHYSKGYFTGTDNLGKHAWGIYGKTVFAGMYDGRFFWGKYRSGKWKAHGLFGLRYARGNYVLFPGIRPVVAHAEPIDSIV